MEGDGGRVPQLIGEFVAHEGAGNPIDHLGHPTPIGRCFHARQNRGAVDERVHHVARLNARRRFAQVADRIDFERILLIFEQHLGNDAHE